ETGIVARLSDCLRLVNGLRDRAQDLLPRLACCFIAEDRAAAQRLAGQYPHLYFLLPDGVCYHGYALSGGKKRSSGPLALKREQQEALESARQNLEELETETHHAREEHAALRVELAALEERHRSEQSATSRLESQLRERTGRREEISREIERLAVERSRLLADNIELDRRSSELSEQALSIDAEVNRLAAQEAELR